MRYIKPGAARCAEAMAGAAGRAPLGGCRAPGTGRAAPGGWRLLRLHALPVPLPLPRRSAAVPVLACPGASGLRGGQRPRRLLHGSAHPQGTGLGSGRGAGRGSAHPGRHLCSQQLLGWFSGLPALLQTARCCWGASWGSPAPTKSSWVSLVGVGTTASSPARSWAVQSGLSLVAVSSSQVIFLESALLKVVVTQQE